MNGEPNGDDGRRGPPMDVTVIGGYLGAGKTTLVNHVLQSSEERVAVLVNDFGDINIDAALIESRDGDTLSLANGCICCSLVDGFAAALATVRSFDPAPARLVIEASGVADPAAVAAYGHAPGLALDATVVMVDAETIRTRADDIYVGDVVRAQLRAADIIVLNKIDLVDSTSAEATEAWVRGEAPHAGIVASVQAQVDPAVLFGASTGRRRTADAQAAPAAHEVFESWTWQRETAIGRDRLVEFVESLPAGVVRGKGVVSLAGSEGAPMVFQLVGRRWTLRPHHDPDAPGSRLVFIGRPGALSVAAIDAALS